MRSLIPHGRRTHMGVAKSFQLGPLEVLREGDSDFSMHPGTPDFPFALVSCPVQSDFKAYCLYSLFPE